MPHILLKSALHTYYHCITYLLQMYHWTSYTRSYKLTNFLQMFQQRLMKIWALTSFKLCMINLLFKFGAFPVSFLSFYFHQFSLIIQSCLVIICPLVMLSYPHNWWFPMLWNSPISRAIITHSTREHRRRE